MNQLSRPTSYYITVATHAQCRDGDISVADAALQGSLYMKLIQADIPDLSEQLPQHLYLDYFHTHTATYNIHMYLLANLITRKYKSPDSLVFFPIVTQTSA